MPTKYIILERSGSNLGFRKIGETKSKSYDVKTSDNEIHSFRIVAANEGGLSFPSETLALRESGDDRKPLLIVNGFSRISGPEHFSADGRAGFDAEKDFGVPYLRDIGFTGYQTEFRRGAGEGFGRSAGNHIADVIAGNSLDYPYVHGKAAADAGYGFVSCSAASVAGGKVRLGDFKIVDWILGKQKRTTVGRGHSGVHYQTFPQGIRDALRNFTSHGGDLIVTGEYVLSDLLDPRASADERDFAADVLGIASDSVAQRQRGGKVSVRAIPGFNTGGRTIKYSNDLNEKQYIVENPDVIAPADRGEVIMTFTDSGLPAAVMSGRGKSRRIVCSIPLESVSDEVDRATLMKDWLRELER